MIDKPCEKVNDTTKLLLICNSMCITQTATAADKKLFFSLSSRIVYNIKKFCFPLFVCFVHLFVVHTCECWIYYDDDEHNALKFKNHQEWKATESCEEFLGACFLFVSRNFQQLKFSLENALHNSIQWRVLKQQLKWKTEGLSCSSSMLKWCC